MFYVNYLVQSARYYCPCFPDEAVRLGTCPTSWSFDKVESEAGWLDSRDLGLNTSLLTHGDKTGL